MHESFQRALLVWDSSLSMLSVDGCEAISNKRLQVVIVDVWMVAKFNAMIRLLRRSGVRSGEGVESFSEFSRSQALNRLGRL